MFSLLLFFRPRSAVTPGYTKPQSVAGWSPRTSFEITPWRVRREMAWPGRNCVEWTTPHWTKPSSHGFPRQRRTALQLVVPYYRLRPRRCMRPCTDLKPHRSSPATGACQVPPPPWDPPNQAGWWSQVCRSRGCRQVPATAAHLLGRTRHPRRSSVQHWWNRPVLPPAAQQVPRRRQQQHQDPGLQAEQGPCDAAADHEQDGDPQTEATDYRTLRESTLPTSREPRHTPRQVHTLP